MLSSSAGQPRRSQRRRGSIGAGAAVLGLIFATGCQVEYAGMTLPSGKYMHDDVQYFAPGPEFPYANTQAATQRARMAANGIPVPPPPGAAVMAPIAGAPGPDGVPVVAPAPVGGALPRLGPMPEGEANAPGGPAAPNPVPGPGPAAPAPPGGGMPAPF